MLGKRWCRFGADLYLVCYFGFGSCRRCPGDQPRRSAESSGPVDSLCFAVILLKQFSLLESQVPLSEARSKQRRTRRVHAILLSSTCLAISALSSSFLIFWGRDCCRSFRHFVIRHSRAFKAQRSEYASRRRTSRTRAREVASLAAVDSAPSKEQDQLSMTTAVACRGIVGRTMHHPHHFWSSGTEKAP